MENLKIRSLLPCIFYILCNLLFNYGFAAAQDQESSKPLFKQLADAGFTLQRSLSGPDIGEAATFSFLSTLEDKTIYMADFALSWHPPRILYEVGPFDFSFQTSVEGKLTSDESEAEDAWKLRASLVGDTSQVGPFDSSYTSISLKYESDQDFDTQKFTAEVQFTPTIRKLALGKAWPVALLDPSGRAKQYPSFQFLWRPFLGLDVGHTLYKGESAETEDTILRLYIRGRVQLFLNHLAQVLGCHEVSIFADDTFYHLPLEDKENTHNYLVAGIQFLVSENISIGLTYKVGEEAPNFEQIKTLGGTVGIRF